MGSFSFPISSAAAIPEMFNDMPSTIKAYLKEGFVVLARVIDRHIETLVPLAAQAVQTPYKVDEDELALQLGIPSKDAGHLLSAVSLLTAVVSGGGDTPEQIVSAAVEANLIPQEARNAAAAFATALVPRRDTLKRTLDVSRLAARVLPSLTSFDVAVDVRLSFEKGKPKLAVPVAVAHLDTDAEGGEIWFQMQKTDVEKLVEDLGRTLKEMMEAQRWAQENH